MTDGNTEKVKEKEKIFKLKPCYSQTYSKTLIDSRFILTIPELRIKTTFTELFKTQVIVANGGFF